MARGPVRSYVSLQTLIWHSSCYPRTCRYLVLNTVLALYVALVEKSTIYEGKRRTIAARVSCLVFFSALRRG